MKRILTLFFLCFAIQSFAQFTLKGRVTAADTKKPLPLVNVFLSNTSIGTVTNEAGEFSIDRFPPGRYDVVVSCIGYETYIVSLQGGQLPADLQVSLKLKVNELQEVVLEPYLKDGWEKWGSYFMENVIGTSALAADCKLKNPQVIKFRFDKKQNVLRAYADEPLILENKALGYTLKYDLVLCEFNHNTKITYYQGYPLFEAMESKRKRQVERWEKNRTDAYQGSMMHFMRSLFRNRILEEGFEVRKLIKIKEEEKKRVGTLYKKKITQGLGTNTPIVISDSLIGNGNKDSAAYYGKVMRQPEKMNVLINVLLTGDSIAYAIDSLTAGFTFDDYLQVIYKYKTLPEEFVKRNFGFNSKNPLSSEMTIPVKQEIAVWANGSYAPNLAILTSGYWGWWEKLATMLPFDYVPQRGKDK